MKVSLLGVRGSIPTTGADTRFYGGNTTCVVVQEEDCRLVLDGGSGIQTISLPSYVTKRIDILLTHLHIDHILGLGFFRPLFDPDREVHIWGPVSATQSLHSRLSRYLSPPLFPVLLRDLPCRLELHDIAHTDFYIGPFQIQTRYIIHPGPTLGFRISTGKTTLAFMPDHEPALGRTGLPADPRWISGYDLAVEADLLIHDGQYTAEEYAKRYGWGHSSMEDAILLAQRCGVSRLILTHHDPYHSDDQLNSYFSGLRATLPAGLDVTLAREGMEIDLG
jgi:ribonuclease BN (tRNA processing enzyme)